MFRGSGGCVTQPCVCCVHLAGSTGGWLSEPRRFRLFLRDRWGAGAVSAEWRASQPRRISSSGCHPGQRTVRLARRAPCGGATSCSAARAGSCQAAAPKFWLVLADSARPRPPGRCSCKALPGTPALPAPSPPPRWDNAARREFQMRLLSDARSRHGAATRNRLPTWSSSRRRRPPPSAAPPPIVPRIGLGPDTRRGGVPTPDPPRPPFGRSHTGHDSVSSASGGSRGEEGCGGAPPPRRWCGRVPRRPSDRRRCRR